MRDPTATTREINFDGIVGPTHNYAGLSRGNLASTRHRGVVSNPKAAALQGIAKMRFVSGLGVPQAVLPPQPRPDVAALRRLGFTGDDAAVLARAAEGDGHFLRLCASASSMWTANAATVIPSADSRDGRTHLIVANLASMFHRSLEAPVTASVMRAIFADPTAFVVHDPLPGATQLSDEGAANHTRLVSDRGVVHLFGWGRRAWDATDGAGKFPRRQSLEASTAVARLGALPEPSILTWQQSPVGIDAGAFHTDVVAVGHGDFLMLHEHAFVDTPSLLAGLEERLGDSFSYCLATSDELPLEDAVNAYPFNSELVTLPTGATAIVAPTESRDNERARRFLERVVAEPNPVSDVFYVEVNASMQNGGGPACLRLRVFLTDSERERVTARVFFDTALDAALVAWVEQHYRDRLHPSDLADPALLDESRTALDALTTLFGIGSVYDFQR